MKTALIMLSKDELVKKVIELEKEAQRYFEKTVQQDKVINVMLQFINEIDVDETICKHVDTCPDENDCFKCMRKHFEKEAGII